MRGLLAALAIALLTPPARAEPRIILVRELPGDSARRDVAANILPLADGALVTGWTSAGGLPPDGLVVRVDSEANVIWRRELGGDPADLLFAAQADSEGGFVCAGFTASRGAGATDGWIVRLDAAGATTWERTYGSAEEDRLTSIQPTREGWMLAGQTSRAGNVDAWVLPVDRAGGELGQWRWGGPAVERGIGLEPLPDGGCVMVGRIGEGREAVDGFVTRLSRDGRQVWTHAVGGPGFQVAYHLRPHRDGSFLVTGYGFAGAGRDHDACVLRIDADGRVLWRSDLGGSAYDRATQSVVLEDGSSVTVGYSKRPGAADEEPAWQMVLYGLDPRGRPTWDRRLGGEGVESGRWIAGTPGNLWVVGQTSTASGGSRVLVARLDATASERAGDAVAPADQVSAIPRDAFIQDLAWSPDGNRFLISVWSPRGYQLFVVRADGSHPVALTDTCGSSLWGSWSPDGRRVAFASKRNGNTDAYLISATGEGLVRLTDHPAVDTGPAWSPDGRSIAFTSRREGPSRVFVMPVEGGAARRVTDGPGEEGHPVWSPDGGTLAFYATRDSADSIVTVRLADGARRNLGLGVWPGWSPDGRRLVFAAKPDDPLAVYVMDADGSGRTRLVEDGFFARFAPDGMRIAFLRSRHRRWPTPSEVWLMKPDGSDSRRILPP